MLKRLLWLIPLILLMQCSRDDSSSYLKFDSSAALKRYMKWSEKAVPLISAHRGGPMDGFPENAIETFENALKFGPCLIECDVRVSRDGELVMMHDERIDRTTNGKGPVSAFTLAQLKMFDLVDPEGNLTEFKIPTLDETLEWAKGRAVLTLDVKQDIEPSHVISVIRQHKAEGHVIIIVYDFEQMMAYYNLADDLMISVSAGSLETVQAIFSSGIPLSTFVVFVGVYEPIGEVYDMLHLRRIRTILGTMHNLDNKAAVRGTGVYKDLYRNGADILSTDNVPLVSQAIKEMKR